MKEEKLMKITTTERGFPLIEFEDSYDKSCHLQISSIASYEAIWLGLDDAEPVKLVQGEGWKDVELPKDVFINTAMHLSRDQVRKLLPYLQEFAANGYNCEWRKVQ
jgi:hypothetical protein